MSSAREILRTMSAENVETVKALFEAWEKGDRDAALAVIDPNIDVDVQGWAAILGDPGRGRDALDRTVQGWLDSWAAIEFFPAHFIDADDHVIVWLTMEGRGRGSGVPTQMRGAVVYTLRNGLVTAMRGFDNLAAAATAVGI